MTPQELKNSVLQLAIQGRLVEQRPEEGTAGELFAQIQEEKQRLVQEGKIKANKKIEPISDDTIPFDIPDSWVWIRFGNLVNYSMGKTPPRAESEWWGGDIPWVSIADMPESGHLHETKESVTPTAFDKKFGNKISPAGTLLMSFKLTVGRVSILDVDAVHNEAIISIHPLVDDTGTEKMYLFYILPFISQFGESKNAIKGKTLNDASISNLLIPLPPLSEQKRIVAKIEELLPLVDRYEAAWTRLEDFNRRFPEDMKKSILQHAIQGKLVEQRPEEGTAEELYEQIQAEKRRLIKEGKIKKEKPLPEITEDEIPFEIPESWMWVRLQQIGELSRGRSQKRPRNDPALFTNGTFPFIQTGDVARANGHIAHWTTMYNQEGVAQSRIWPAGTVCLTIAANIGDVAILNFDACFPDSVVGFNAYRPILSNEFFMYGLMCYKTIIDKMSRSTAQKNINIDILSQIAFPLPPLAEQKRIVARLEELLPLCERLK